MNPIPWPWGAGHGPRGIDHRTSGPGAWGPCSPGCVGLWPGGRRRAPSTRAIKPGEVCPNGPGVGSGLGGHGPGEGNTGMLCPECQQAGAFTLTRQFLGRAQGLCCSQVQASSEQRRLVCCLSFLICQADVLCPRRAAGSVTATGTGAVNAAVSLGDDALPDPGPSTGGVLGRCGCPQPSWVASCVVVMAAQPGMLVSGRNLPAVLGVPSRGGCLGGLACGAQVG